MSDELTETNDPMAIELEGFLRELREDVRRRATPAELRAIPFNGAISAEFMDDAGAAAHSYGILNPTEIRAYINFGGGPARQGSAIPVPPESALIMPLFTLGHVNLGMSAEELGEETALIYRLRFHSVQPFFLGSLS